MTGPGPRAGPDGTVHAVRKKDEARLHTRTCAGRPPRVLRLLVRSKSRFPGSRWPRGKPVRPEPLQGAPEGILVVSAEHSYV